MRNYHSPFMQQGGRTMPSFILVADIIAGAVLLLAGRRLFWLFVAVTGFFVGAAVAGNLFLDQPQWVVWIVAAGAGIIGAVLAILLQRVAFAVAGFYAGAYLAITLVQSLDWGMPDMAVYLTGGLLGALLAAFVMDWAIIVLSSLVGSVLIVTPLNLQPFQGALLASVLAAVGILVQAKFTRIKPDTPSQDIRK